MTHGPLSTSLAIDRERSRLLMEGIDALLKNKVLAPVQVEDRLWLRPLGMDEFVTSRGIKDQGMTMEERADHYERLRKGERL